ncbi:protein-lysine methyltransferase METTL21D-like [Papaver somniferum]|uniref:protein-lysine methyltransferase METTL21D-like n=1 Tax=Papaver somniferum TaxID=3469 RepID=UPI000E6F9CCD|nr:protein-lysine methyltransferase METTL21D-like [Papaver somniferum]
MKFTDSPVIELKVRDKTLAIEQDNGSMHVGTSVWPCSLVLVKFLERWLLSNSSSSSSSSSSSTTPKPYTHLLNFSGKKAIELGCGCGPAGMGLILLGLENIILTDIIPVMPALKRNLKRNKPVLGKNLKISQLYWNNLNQIKTLNPPFDFVIAADVVYIEESVGHLVSAMESLVSDTGFILLGYQIRSPEAHKLFWELCENVFVIEKVPHEDLHPEYAYEEADVYVMKKKMAN